MATQSSLILLDIFRKLPLGFLGLLFLGLRLLLLRLLPFILLGPLGLVGGFLLGLFRFFPLFRLGPLGLVGVLLLGLLALLPLFGIGPLGFLRVLFLGLLGLLALSLLWLLRFVGRFFVLVEDLAKDEAIVRRTSVRDGSAETVSVMDPSLVLDHGGLLRSEHDIVELLRTRTLRMCRCMP